MKIIFRTESLREALEKYMKITKMEYGCMKVEGNDIYIYGGDAMKYIKLHVDSKILSKGKIQGFSFNIHTLKKLSKQSNTDKITVEVKGKKLIFIRSDKDSKMRGEFQIRSDMDEEQEIDKKNSIELTKMHTQSISKAIRYCNIKSLHKNVLDLPLNVIFNTDGMNMFISDGYHYAYALDRKATLKKEVKFDIPVSIYSSIEHVANGADFKISVTDSHIYAYGVGFEASFLILQHMRDRKVELQDMVENYKSKFPNKKNSAQFRLLKMPLSRLLKSIDNLASVSEGKNIIEFKSKNKNLLMSISSQLGKVLEIINVTTNWKDTDKFLISEFLLKDIFDLYPKKSKNLAIYFKGGKGSSMSIKYNSKDFMVVYVCSLLLD